MEDVAKDFPQHSKKNHPREQETSKINLTVGLGDFFDLPPWQATQWYGRIYVSHQ